MGYERLSRDLSFNTPLVTISPDAFEEIYAAMGDGGMLLRDVDATLRSERGVWIIDVGWCGFDAMELTLDAGSNMGSIVRAVSEIAYGKMCENRQSGYRMPPLSTRYLCDDGEVRTLGQMLEGYPPGLMPSDEEELEFLLGVYGCDFAHRDWRLTPSSLAE